MVFCSDTSTGSAVLGCQAFLDEKEFTVNSAGCLDDANTFLATRSIMLVLHSMSLILPFMEGL